MQPKRCAKLLAALAAPERLEIVRCLREGPKNVTQIAGWLKTSVVKASHHLAVLRNAGIVKSERQGRFMLYSLRSRVFQPAADSSPTEHLDLGCCRLEMPRPDG
jgi:DNA-binding transcriptional ArsR family regulator